MGTILARETLMPMLNLKPHLRPMLRLMLMLTMVTMDMVDMVLGFLTIHMPLPTLMLAIQLTAMDFMDIMDTSARGLLSLMVLLLLHILLELLGTQAMLPAMLGPLPLVILVFIMARGPLMPMLKLMLMPITVFMVMEDMDTGSQVVIPT